MNTTVFKPVMSLQRPQIRHILTFTSSLAPLQSLSKYNITDGQGPSSSLWPSNLENKEPKGYNHVVKTSSNNIHNLDERKTFWYPTNANDLGIQTLGIIGNDNSHGIAKLWAIGMIEEAWQESRFYNL